MFDRHLWILRVGLDFSKKEMVHIRCCFVSYKRWYIHKTNKYEQSATRFGEKNVFLIFIAWDPLA
jgi:hypothetical protein